jgi:hypothetical protein
VLAAEPGGHRQVHSPGGARQSEQNHVEAVDVQSVHAICPVGQAESHADRVQVLVESQQPPIITQAIPHPLLPPPLELLVEPPLPPSILPPLLPLSMLALSMLALSLLALSMLAPSMLALSFAALSLVVLASFPPLLDDPELLVPLAELPLPELPLALDPTVASRAASPADGPASAMSKYTSSGVPFAHAHAPSGNRSEHRKPQGTPTIQPPCDGNTSTGPADRNRLKRTSCTLPGS